MKSIFFQTYQYIIPNTKYNNKCSILPYDYRNKHIADGKAK